ncbi:TIM barrel protein [Mitsuokella jalaludinii]|uniref:TIM barrel protein n=1 Tax=Mitsuokella jalaludinii TaxID=187979 RepID=UPI0025944B83|nr:TIM barrel protein [uncultured Mitsuokella sp.]
MKRCACIDTLYTEIPFEDRFAAAKRDGFESVEFWDWRIRDLKKVRAAAEAAGIAISGFNGDNDFSLVDPEQEKPYLEALKASLEAAQAVGAETVTIHSNALGDGGVVVNHYDELSDTVKLCSMYRTLTESVKLAEAYKIRMNLEALNIKIDHVGNFLQTTQMAAEVTRLIDSPYLMVLFDAYHMQYNEGALCYNLEKYIDQIGHIHVADCPGRHEPGTGEICYHNVYETLKRLGYQYRVGYELFPEKDTKTAVAAIMQD